MMAHYSDEIVEDDFGNLRYIGKDPNNYVTFNNELWRIIGVMKGIENPDGSNSDKVKLIRNGSIGSYSWDNKPSGTGSSTSSYGSNDWSDSTLQKVLNEGAYWNRTVGDCPKGSNGATVACDFSKSGLTEEAKLMISESVWNLGGKDEAEKSTKEFYELERGANVYEGRPTKWTGSVGLMYPSDYGYATSGGSTTNRATCLNTNLSNWWNVNDCVINDWLFVSSNSQWTLTPSSFVSDKVFSVGLNYKVNSGLVYWDRDLVRISIYLDSKVVVESGNNGSRTSPFVLK